MELAKIRPKPASKKITKKIAIGGNVKSQVNIKKYFESKEKIIDSGRGSENKRTSLNSGIAVTTTSTKKLRNVGSIGSLNHGRAHRMNLFSSKLTEPESNLEYGLGGNSGSPVSDIINIGSARPNNIDPTHQFK